MALVLRGRYTSDPTATLKQALATFETGLTPAQTQQLRALSTTPDATSVVQFVTEVDADDRDRAGRCFASRLCTFLDATQQFTGVVGTFVSSNPAIAAVVWGSVSTTILIASNVTYYFDKVTGLVMNVGKLCPTYAKFGHLFPGCIELQSALGDYFAVVIQICSKIVDVVRRPVTTQVLSSIWSPFESEFKALLSDLERASKSVHLAISLASELAAKQAAKEQKLNHRIAATFRNDAKVEFARASRWRDELREKETRRMRMSVRESLSTVDHLKSWRQARRELVPGTGEWIEQEDCYKNWRHERKSAVLLCSGTIGYRKTVLASQIIAGLLRARNASEIVSYFFCRSEQKASLRAQCIIGSLARQILDSVIETIAADSLEVLNRQSQDLDEHDVVDLINTYGAKDTSVYVVLDGLDECEDVDVREVCRCLARLLAEMPVTLKIAIWSRPELRAVVSNCLELKYRLNISREKNSADIKQFILARLEESLDDDRLKLVNATKIIGIATALEEGSEGM